MAPRKRSFDELTERGEGCWLWRGGLSPNGYGRFYLAFIDGKPKMVGAHRYAWEQANRPLLPGEVVLHSCDNPPCVRPDHLFVGSQADNLRDAAAKGRLTGSIHDKGMGHGFAKLTDDAVVEIRRLSRQGTGQRQIAARFGVNQSQISRIINDKRWSHVH